MNQKKESVILLLSLLITTAVIGGGVWWLFANNRSINTPDGDRPQNVSLDDRDLQPSRGERILLQDDSNPEKQEAAQAIANKNYAEAEFILEQSLSQQRNDPEALIYLNNARIADSKAYTIAVSVPVGTELTTAKELLRGVAQAQDEINRQGGINSVPLKVAIVNDNNDPQLAEQVAQKLVRDKDILGVIGHFSSDVTLATAPIYEKNKLVVISPSSTSVELSKAGEYIFRTVPSDRFTSNALSKYFIEQLLSKAAVVYNSQSAYSRSLQETFAIDVVSNGGEIALEIDLAENNFNPAQALKNAAAQEAEAIVFLNNSTTLDKAYLLMQLNQRNLPLLGGDSLYKPQTLEIGGEQAVGLIIGVPWHAAGSANAQFSQNARLLWGGDVNWRTAMAYDATKALAAGLAIEPSRQGIQEALSQSGFSVEGASGNIKFLSSGDRNAAVQLVKIQPGNNSSYGYDFVPLE